MKSNTQKWIDNFSLELVNIQIQFDAFFAEGNIENYYKLHVHEETGMLTLHISKHNDLPKEIADALNDAFIKSKPDNQVNGN